MAKVDIRGTGSFEGILIERESTLQELDDCDSLYSFGRVLPRVLIGTNLNGQ